MSYCAQTELRLFHPPVVRPCHVHVSQKRPRKEARVRQTGSKERDGKSNDERVGRMIQATVPRYIVPHCASLGTVLP